MNGLAKFFAHSARAQRGILPRVRISIRGVSGVRLGVW